MDYWKNVPGIKESAGTPKAGEVWLLGKKEIIITKVGSGLANDKHIDFEFVDGKKKSGMKIIDFFNKAKLKESDIARGESNLKSPVTKKLNTIVLYANEAAQYFGFGSDDKQVKHNLKMIKRLVGEIEKLV